MFSKKIQKKREKYLNNDSIVLGSYSYLDKRPGRLEFYVKDFNDRIIFIIPGYEAKYDESLKVATYIFECFEGISEPFEAFTDYQDKKNETEKLVSSIYNKGIKLNDICYIAGEEYNKVQRLTKLKSLTLNKIGLKA